MARSQAKKAAAPKARKAASGARFGGLAARSGKGPLWKFTEAGDGSFIMPDPQYVGGIYFPICNTYGMKSSVTADFKGDICRDFHSFLSIPTDVEDLHRITNSRNFWVYVDGKEPWSATGVSAPQTARLWEDSEDAVVSAGIGYYGVSRTSKALKLKATVTSFVPADDEMVELMHVRVENVGRKDVRFTPTFATPIFGRTADNLRDHRTVTTMFSRIWLLNNGVRLSPTIHHDERGHTPNSTSYFVLGATGKGAAPRQIWGNMRDFCGEGGTMDAPEAVFKNISPPKKAESLLSGREGVGAVRFAPVTLKPGQSAGFVFMFGISDNAKDADRWLAKYGDEGKVLEALERTKAYWRGVSGNVSFETDDQRFGNWMRWVATQSMYRKIYGNSYLLDFGYGRGGRGWRDLWSDLLAIFLIDAAAGREEIINNFRGVRVDGTNATIVGTKLGEFIADRNAIVRTWSDHGTWPFHVLRFYMDQSGEFSVLLNQLPYWKDQFTHRSRRNDPQWDRSHGNLQKTSDGKDYSGTILEHVLLELLSSFYHVGQHNNPLLEGADWNDTYDGAREKGETVCFFSYYQMDLRLLADTLELMAQRQGLKEVELLEDMLTLLDRLGGQNRINYDNWQDKRAALSAYFDRVSHAVSGRKVKVKVADLVADLRAKADWIRDHIRGNEWIATKDGERFFNGHYDNDAARVDGDNPHGVRMDLTSQVFPTLSGVATDEQVAALYKAARRYLRDKNVGGLHLCTDLKELKLNLGRVAGFTYGYKEHGGIWNQMNVMFLLGLYTRGFVKEGCEVFNDIYNLAMNTAVSRIYPCIPSFFDIYGRGGYSYLTGSATWLVLGMLTQVFGCRGEAGDLRIEPKLVAQQFGQSGRAACNFDFGGKRLRVTYLNPGKLEFGAYSIASVKVNGQDMRLSGKSVLLGRDALLAACNQPVNQVEVSLA
jgi:cellobiose phosphorylase